MGALSYRERGSSIRFGDVKLGIPSLGKALDAGLVKTVEALLRAGQFHRVANLVAASEPLARFALRRMREIVGDQLLVRTAAGLELTRRARRLAAPFRDLLERISEVLSGRNVFDPAFCDPGGRTSPPLSQAEFHRVVRRWTATGAACPA